MSTSPEIAVRTYFHAQNGFKTTQVFLPADEETSCWFLPSLVCLLSVGTLRPGKNLFLYPQGDRLAMRKPKKEQPSTLIAATTRVYLPKSVSANLAIQIQF